MTCRRRCPWFRVQPTEERLQATRLLKCAASRLLLFPERCEPLLVVHRDWLCQDVQIREQCVNRVGRRRDVFLTDRIYGPIAHVHGEHLAQFSRTLLDFRERAPGLAYAHPTVDHFVPLFIALGASLDTASGQAHTQIDGYWMANSKRSLQFA